MSPTADGRVKTTWKWGNREQFGLARRHPLVGSSALALRAVPVAAAVVGDRGVGAVLAARDVSAERRRAATFDGAHHFELEQAHVTAVGMTPRGPVVAEDVRDLQSWTGHVGPLGWRLGLLRHQRREPVQR